MIVCDILQMKLYLIAEQEGNECHVTLNPPKPSNHLFISRSIFATAIQHVCLAGGGFFSSHILPVTNNIHCNRYVALSEGTEIG